MNDINRLGKQVKEMHSQVKSSRFSEDSLVYKVLSSSNYKDSLQGKQIRDSFSEFNVILKSLENKIPMAEQNKMINILKENNIPFKDGEVDISSFIENHKSKF